MAIGPSDMSVRHTNKENQKIVMIDFFIFVRESCKETTYSRSQGIVISYSLGFLPHFSPSEKEKEKAYFFFTKFYLVHPTQPDK